MYRQKDNIFYKKGKHTVFYFNRSHRQLRTWQKEQHPGFQPKASCGSQNG